MDLYIDPEVTGEVLIPLENGSFFPNKNIPSFQDISTCSYKKFRNVLFQGECLKFYIVLIFTLDVCSCHFLELIEQEF